MDSGAWCYSSWSHKELDTTENIHREAHKTQRNITSAYQFIKGYNKGGASLVAQMVKNLPAKQRLWIDPWVQMIP